jgi:hypothetical protein
LLLSRKRTANYFTTPKGASPDVASPENARKRAAEDLKENGPSKKAKFETLYLPPEIWGQVLDFLEYSDVMQCAAVSRFFLHEALPKISVLFMNNKNQLKPEQARRFKNGSVKTVIFVCFLKRTLAFDDDGDLRWDDVLCETTAVRSICFLQLFSGLKCAMFCGYRTREEEDVLMLSRDKTRWHTHTGVCCRPFARPKEGVPDDPEERAQYNEIARGLLKALTSAMFFRLLPTDLWIEDCSAFVRCCESRREEACKSCCNVCESISIEQVYDLTRETYGIVCLPVTEVVSIHCPSRGWGEFLRDPKRFLPLFSRSRSFGSP